MRPCPAHPIRILSIATALGGLVTAAIVLPASAGQLKVPVFPVATQLTASFPYGLTQGEPNIKADNAGNLYVMAAGSTPIGCELWKLAPGAHTQTFLGAPDDGAGGGDCDIQFSPNVPAGQTQQTLTYASLSLPNITTGSSTDGGQSFSTPNPVASQIPGDDRQWLAAAGDNTFYLSSHIVASDNIAVSKSTDGGLTWSFVGLAIDPAHIAQAAYNNELGPLVVDTTSPLTPKPVYTMFTAPSTATANVSTAAGTTQSSNNALYLASSYDGGVTWTDTPIYIGPTTATYDHIFPTLSIDSSGVLWTAFSDNQHVYVAHANSRGGSLLTQPGTDTVTTDSAGALITETFTDLTTAPAGTLPWSAPVQIDTPSSPTNIFAWVAGGGANRADMVWYGGTGANPDDPNGQWVVHLAQLHETKKGLVVTQTVASDHVMHVGQICETGVNCSVNGNRDLLDFLQVTVTPDGRGAIAWSDDTAAPPAAQIYVSEQCSGFSSIDGSSLTTTC